MGCSGVGPLPCLNKHLPGDMARGPPPCHFETKPDGKTNILICDGVGLVGPGRFTTAAAERPKGLCREVWGPFGSRTVANNHLLGLLVILIYVHCPKSTVGTIFVQLFSISEQMRTMLTDGRSTSLSSPCFVTQVIQTFPQPRISFARH